VLSDSRFGECPQLRRWQRESSREGDKPEKSATRRARMKEKKTVPCWRLVNKRSAGETDSEKTESSARNLETGSSWMQRGPKKPYLGRGREENTDADRTKGCLSKQRKERAHVNLGFEISRRYWPRTGTKSSSGTDPTASGTRRGKMKGPR